jgi:hypothetical protein
MVNAKRSLQETPSDYALKRMKQPSIDESSQVNHDSGNNLVLSTFSYFVDLSISYPAPPVSSRGVSFLQPTSLSQPTVSTITRGKTIPKSSKKRAYIAGVDYNVYWNKSHPRNCKEFVYTLNDNGEVVNITFQCNQDDYEVS